MAEEDRISNLPDEIIHRILSFLDLKYAMQTSSLSKKWKLVWTLLTQLNLDSYKFSDMSHFDKFVNHVLLHRNHHKEVSVLELRCRGAATRSSVASIVRYACFHNVRRLNIVWCGTMFPEFVFSCRALKDLTLAVEDRTSCSARSYISASGWDFPTLEKLNLKNFQISNRKNTLISLFSKCVKLKDLTLCEISMHGLVELNLCLPQLSSLSVTSCYRYPKFLNVVAPQLQNLTASVDFVDALHRSDLLQMYTVQGFDYLEKVNLAWPEIHNVLEKKARLSQLLGVFQKLYSTKCLILDAYVTMVLSSSLDQLLLEPCPFNNLKCLKINTMLVTRNGRSGYVVVPVQLNNYFLDKSPTATFITDYPQPRVTRKTPVQKVHDDDAMANKLAKSESVIKQQLDTLSKDKRLLEAKILMQDQVATKQNETFVAEIAMKDKVPRKRFRQRLRDDARAKKTAKLDLEKQPLADTIITQDKEILDLEKQPNTITEAKEILDANIQMQDEVISKQESMLEAKIQMQEQAIAKQKAMFEAHIHMLDQVIIKQNAKVQVQDQIITGHKAMFEDQRQMQDQVITKQKAMFEAKIQMQDQVITKQKAMFEAKIQMLDNVIAEQKAKIQMQDNIVAEQKGKIQMQDNVIAEQRDRIQMVEVAKLDHEKLISYVINSKIAELKVQVESGNPDFEVTRSIGSEIKSVMEMIPESLKAVMDAQFSFEYVQLKSFFVTHIDAS
ncbi:uncharacterized protein [Rutidosis leptorrhynchoides]|uniref:uncharacterized protein isoform X1 n=1 Tax=Rutidosis leptorrhynchoides TaxID=125765 RepID=UPI003A99453E